MKVSEERPCFSSFLFYVKSLFLTFPFLSNKYLFTQVNLEYLESKLECLDGEEVQQIQDNINSLFHHCVQAMAEEHQIKVVNALQVCHAHFTTSHTTWPQTWSVMQPGRLPQSGKNNNEVSSLHSS